MAYVGKVTDTAGNTHLVGSTLYGTCPTAAATAAKVVTCPDFSKLETGVTIHVKFTLGNTANTATLNVNSTGAKSLWGVGPLAPKILQNGVISVTYDGEEWVANDSFYADTMNTAGAEYDPSNTLYLIGARTQTASPVTYSGSVRVADGDLFADSFNGVQIDTSSSTGFKLLADDNHGLTVPYGQDYTLGAACEKGVDTSVSSSATNSNVPTSLAVYNAIQNAITGVAEYRGSVSAESSLLNTALTKGWYYIVAMPNAQTSSITIGGKTCEAGDMVWIRDSGTYTTSSSLGDHIDIIQSNIDTLTNPEITTIWNNAVPVS